MHQRVPLASPTACFHGNLNDFDPNKMKSKDSVGIAWGWIALGIPECNRRMQIEALESILKGDGVEPLDVYLAMPAWAFDRTAYELADAEIRTLFAPLPEDLIVRVREAVQAERLSLILYAYGCNIPEGMHGEAVQKTYRLSQKILAERLGAEPEWMMVHDGPTPVRHALQWGSEISPHLVGMLGLRGMAMGSRRPVQLPDGFVIPALAEDPSQNYFLAELMDFPRASARYSNLQTTDARKEPIPLDRSISKGWYGGGIMVQQMQAILRRCDLKLVALEAKAAASGKLADLEMLWRQVLILQDSCMQWLLNDIEDGAFRIAGNVEAKLNELLGCDTLPAPSRLSKLSKGPWCLKNDLICVEAGLNGEILGIRDRNGTPLLSGGKFNVIRRYENRWLAESPELVESIHAWNSEFSGGVILERTFAIAEDDELQFDIFADRGLPTIIESDEGEFAFITARHWGGGVPTQVSNDRSWGYGTLKLRKGERNIRIHIVADRGFSFQRFKLSLQRADLDMAGWSLQKRCSWEDDKIHVLEAFKEELESGQRLILKGRIGPVPCELCYELENGDDVVRSSFRWTAEGRPEGILTPPLEASAGSLLGAGCERPYVPAWTIDHELPDSSWRFFTDKPYTYEEALPRPGWHTHPLKPFFGGIRPILGVDTAFAESPGGSLLMITDGHGHFFERTMAEGHKALGLSLGASIIHPQTQRFKVPEELDTYKVGRNSPTDTPDAFKSYGFQIPKGELQVRWSLRLSDSPHVDRVAAWEARASENGAGWGSLPELRRCPVLDSGSCVLAGWNWDGEKHHLRVVNLSDDASPFSLCMAGRFEPVGKEFVLKHHPGGVSEIKGSLTPRTIREFVCDPNRDRRAVDEMSPCRG